MRSGKTEDLFRVLKAVDESTTIEDVMRSGDRLVATVYPEGNYELSLVAGDASYPLEEGEGSEDLIKSVEENSARINADYYLDVLALCGYRPGSTTRDGRMTSVWARVNPTVPYEIKGGRIPLDMLDVPLSKRERAAAKETGLALYDEEADGIYIIRKCALSSIGKLLDCEAGLKCVPGYPFGAAVSLALRLRDVRNRMFIIRGNSKIKSVIGVTTPKLKRYPQLDFVSGCIDAIRARWPSAEASQWSVSEEMTVVLVRNGDHEFRIATSDSPGTAMTVSAYGLIGKGRVFLARSRANHWSGYEAGGGAKALVDSLWGSFEAFDSDLEALEASECMMPAGVLHRFDTSLGSRRVAGIDTSDGSLPFGKVSRASDVMRAIVDLTWPEHDGLGAKQQEVLKLTYRDLLMEMAGAGRSGRSFCEGAEGPEGLASFLERREEGLKGGKPDERMPEDGSAASSFTYGERGRA